MLRKASGPTADIPFSQTLFNVLNGAKAEAHRLGDTHVRPEHILVALLQEGAAPRAGQALEALHIAPEHIRHALAPELSHAPDRPGELPWDRRAKAVLGRTIEHSRARGRFSSDDLLIAIAEGKGGLAAELLRWQAASPERIREAVASLPDGGGE